MTKYHKKSPTNPSWCPHARATSARRKTTRHSAQDAREPIKTVAEPDDVPVVLLHPLAACSDVWHPILPFLEREHRVLSLAIPGHAGADPVPDDFDYTVSRAADLLESKLDTLGLERAHLVGNSLGGWLALELARRGRARSVVAIAPGGGWEHGSAEHRRLVRKFQVTRKLLSVGGPLAGLLALSPKARAWCLRDAFARPERLTALQAQSFIEAAWRCAIFEGVVKALPNQPLPEPFDPGCPIRLVWGEHDRLLPIKGYSARWRRVLPQAEWMVLPGVGHVPMYDDPEAVATAILDVTKQTTVDSLERIAS